MDLLSINVDELEFDCTLDRFQDEIVHPETGEILRADFVQSGHKIACQNPEIFVHSFDLGGGYEFALGLREGAPPPEQRCVLFAGDMRIGFRIVKDKKYAEDGVTRIWEVYGVGSAVISFSPFSRVKGVDRDTVMIADRYRFQSRPEQDQVIAIFSKAMSSYNHESTGNIVRRDGKPVSEQELKENDELLKTNFSEYEKIYAFEPWMEKKGPAKVEFTDLMQSMLKKGSFIA